MRKHKLVFTNDSVKYVNANGYTENPEMLTIEFYKFEDDDSWNGFLVVPLDNLLYIEVVEE